MNFSILILTKNEAGNISDCLDSVGFCDDVVVLDSGSLDETVQLAESNGCRVFHREFDNFADHRNWALENIQYEYDHVFHLDADERFTPALAAECQKAIDADAYSGFLVSSKLMFMGKWIRHASQFPCYQLRLLKVGEISFVVNGHGQSDGESLRGLGTLKEAYIHYNFSKGLAEWIEKHNRYSSQEANASPVSRAGIDSSNAYGRRKKLKAVAARLPFQPLCRFLYLYLLRGGFLDGKPGYHYCRMVAMYQYWICLKRMEKVQSL